jgi:pantetheine-phosphate adenylyltransferase
MLKEQIQQRLKALSFNDDVVKRYDETHRFYHTFEHLQDVVSYLEKSNSLNDELFLAAVYHDAVYDPKSNTNEEDSANLFKVDAAMASIASDKVASVIQLILDTKHHTASSELSKQFIDADLNIFNESNERLLQYEKQIFKEYQFVDYKTYKENRIKVLEKYNQNGKLDFLISYVKTVMPAIAVFPGSFNPFHKGHYNVLQKAERIFDKVIIAFGRNPDKNQRTWDVPKTIQNRQIAEYEGLVTDFVDSLGYDTIIIRGLRNSTDFQYEQNQYRYIQELKPHVRIVNVFCDKEFEHISSSGIRTLEKYNKHQLYLLD